MMPTNKLTISLVTYNAAKYLSECLTSLVNQTYKDFSLIIIDNGSSDQTLRFLREDFPQFKVVSYKDNIGFAKAHNQAIAWSKSDYLCLLNQDVILEPDYLGKAVIFLEEHPKTASVTGKILTWDFEARQKSRLIDSLGLKILKNHRVIELGQGQLDNGQAQELKEIFGVSGAVPVYRREALDKVQITLANGHKEYFDELFFAYKEDIDLAYRLRLAGYDSYYLPEAVAYHDRSAKGLADLSDKAIKQSRKKKNKMVRVYSYKNHLLTLIKNEFWKNILKYFFPIFWFEFKKLVFILLFEQSTLAGLKMFLAQKGKILYKRKYIIKNIRKVDAGELAKWFESH